MDSLLCYLCFSPLTSTKHFCDNVMPKFSLYEYDEAKPRIVRPLVSDDAVKPAG
jgi:hypothetical protein